MHSDYLTKTDPTRQTIQKKFIYFVLDNVPYTIESFSHEGKQIHLLKIETDVKEDLGDLKIPEFLKVGEDVSEDPKYFNFNIALRK